MALHYRTSGFVLKKKDIGEADRIFTIFTQDFGKIKVSGKAIRKIASKLKGGIDVISLSEIEFIQGKTYKTLTDSIALDKFENIKKSLTKQKISYRIAKSLDSLLRIEEKEETLWNLLKEVFDRLNNWAQENKSWRLQILYYYFLWNLFLILGYQPELYKCASCQKELAASSLYFSAEDGGIICNKCAAGKRKINTDVVKILRLILKKEWLILSKLKVQAVSWKLLKEVSEHYYSYLLSIHSSEEDFQKDNEPL